ncbi:MAG: DUF1343 domain-containing protein, partial [Candidatus Eremiobacteraeota bacterium]|nr:DUF1343 domain-containing protein [Candidatus Eremiobacteraeota bacterium]
AERLAKALNERDIPGVYFRPAYWTPSSGFWKDKELSGVELVVFDPASFPPVRTAVEILCAARVVAPQALKIDGAALDRDWGTDQLRLRLQVGATAGAILGGWVPSRQSFEALRKHYLLYP